MVAIPNANGNSDSSSVTEEGEHIIHAKQTRFDPPFIPKINANDVPHFRGPFEHRGLSQGAVSIILSSWRTSTQKQNVPYLNKWRRYCGSRKLDSLSATIEEGVNFLAELYHEGLGYSALNTARSALSTVFNFPNNQTFGTHPLVTRFMKGVFETRPSMPRYSETWDVNIVLDYLSGLGQPDEQDLTMLTYKTVMLLALLTGQRRQTLHALDITTMDLTSEKCTFVLNSLLKTSRPGKHLAPIELQAYKLDKQLCPVAHITEYIKRTAGLRGNHHKFFISYQKPHQEISGDTISRWLKNTLELAGVNTTKFGAHSTRAASTSAAKAMNMPIDIIMHSAGWSQASTFGKYYHKPVETEANFGNFLLNNKRN